MVRCLQKQKKAREPAMLGSIFALIITIGSIILTLSIRLRLWPILIYITLMATTFADWARTNETLALMGMGIVVLGIVASWICTAINHFRAY